LGNWVGRIRDGCSPPPQELNTSVKDRSVGSGARVERGLPGALAFLVKEGRRWNIVLVG
jgi:hypothetical protein